MSNTFLQNIFMVGADENGDVQAINIGKSDNGTPIYYELNTQELEFGNRAHLKKISNRILALSEFGIDSKLDCIINGEELKSIPIDLSNTVNIGQDIKLEGNFFVFRWYGESDSTSPVFNGLYLENISDLGLTKS